ncbi:hypothetical protein FQN54_001567 [Arachnomyces sp. PD_36]|nr:hypothetical protein FQN54_001567 [Arachnomyces sp. PD_36]
MKLASLAVAVFAALAVATPTVETRKAESYEIANLEKRQCGPCNDGWVCCTTGFCTTC